MKKRFWLPLLLVSFLVSGCGQKKYELQGYVEGDYTYISPNYQGILRELLVHRGTLIKAGTPLFVLEQQPESAEAKQAESQLAQAQAQKTETEARLTLAIIKLKRQKDLFKEKATSKENVDEAQANYDETRAQLTNSNANISALNAALEKARWTKSTKTVYAGEKAFVYDTFYSPGELIQPGQPVLALLEEGYVYVVFYIPEPDLGKIKMGQMIQANCDGCTSPLQAQIDYISPQAEYTPPVIFSNQTRAKLVYRVEAYPSGPDTYKLRPGQPVMVTF